MCVHLHERLHGVLARLGLAVFAAAVALLAVGTAMADPINIDAFSSGDAAVALSGYDDDFYEDAGLNPAQTIGGMRQLHACLSSYIGPGEYMTAAVNVGEGTLEVSALDDVGATLWLNYGTSVYGGAALNADWSGLDRIELTFAQGQEPAVNQVVDIGLTWNWTDPTQFSQGGFTDTIFAGTAKYTVELDDIINLDITDIDGVYVSFWLPGGDTQSFAIDSIRVVPEPDTGAMLLLGLGAIMLWQRLMPKRSCVGRLFHLNVK